MPSNTRAARSVAAFLALSILSVACGGDSENGSDNASSDGGDAPEEADFEGETIELVIGESPGGGTDTIVRTIARHLGEHLPGQPTVAPRNMPGAGGLVAQNFAANAAPDGLTWNGSLGGGTVYSSIGDDPEAEFELQELTWIGNAWGEDRAAWSRTEAFPDAESLINGEPPRLGATSATHSTAVHAKGLASVLDYEIELVYGYDGTAPIMLDVERGALDGRVSSWSSVISSHQDWVDDDFIRPHILLATEPSPRLEGVPTVVDLMPSDDERLITALLGPMDLARSFVGPPGIPDNIRDAMRDAYAAMVEDPDFIEELEGIGFFIDYRSGEELEQTASDLLADEETLETVLGFMAE